MEIFSYGMQMELDGEAFYLEEAGRSEDGNISRILNYLAEEERSHYETLKSFRDGSPELPESSLLADVKNVFQAMKEKSERFVSEKDNLTEVLRKGMQLEDRSIDFYREREKESEARGEKDIFALLVKQEQRHYALLSSLIEYYDRPSNWLENAEFVHLDDY